MTAQRRSLLLVVNVPAAAAADVRPTLSEALNWTLSEGRPRVSMGERMEEGERRRARMGGAERDGNKWDRGGRYRAGELGEEGQGDAKTDGG